MGKVLLINLGKTNMAILCAVFMIFVILKNLIKILEAVVLLE